MSITVSASSSTAAVPSSLTVAPEVTRTTAKPRTTSFGQVVGVAADVALRGVEVGAAFVGGPLLSAAVREVRTGALGGSATAASSGGPLSPRGGSVGGAEAVTDAAASKEQGMMDQMRAMQEDAQSFNLQYLALQEEVQQENRRFTTVSNVLKAKHETAKGAIGNIRS